MELSSDLIKKLKEYPAFSEFQAFIASTILELDSIDGVDKLSNLEAGEEVKARLKAKEKLENILAPFIQFNEKVEPTKEQLKRVNNKFGIKV